MIGRSAPSLWAYFRDGGSGILCDTVPRRYFAGAAATTRRAVPRRASFFFALPPPAVRGFAAERTVLSSHARNVFAFTLGYFFFVFFFFLS